MSKRALWLAFAAVSVGFVVVSCSSSDGNGNFDPTDGNGGEGGDGSGATSSQAGGDNAPAGADSGTGGSNGAPEGGTANSGAGAPGAGGDVSGGGVPSEAGMGPGAAGSPSGEGGAGGVGVVTTCESFKECAEGEICFKEGCGKQKLGVCSKAKSAPVCGCDGITYYDGALAAAGETEVQARGVCGDNAVTCEKECKEGYTCGRVQLRGGDCEAKVGGVCWQLPKECPDEPIVYGFCATDKCLGLCEAVQSGEHAVVDALGCAPIILQ